VVGWKYLNWIFRVFLAYIYCSYCIDIVCIDGYIGMLLHVAGGAHADRHVGADLYAICDTK